jgi:holo-[acyl-carrier protein] synthase
VIYGVGTDVVEISRIEAALARFGERFARRILCEPELRRFQGHRLPAAYLAKRFAAKEAFTKALGTGIHAPANWHGVWVRNLPSGKPVLEFSEPLKALMKARGVAGAHLSLTDERGVAMATVILERHEAETVRPGTA